MIIVYIVLNLMCERFRNGIIFVLLVIYKRLCVFSVFIYLFIDLEDGCWGCCWEEGIFNFD